MMTACRKAFLLICAPDLVCDILALAYSVISLAYETKELYAIGAVPSREGFFSKYTVLHYNPDLIHCV